MQRKAPVPAGGLRATRPRSDADIAALRAAGIWRNRVIHDDAVALAATEPDRVLAIADDRQLTAAGAVRAAHALASALARRGLRRGDVVSYILPNWLETIVVNLAAGALGLIANPIIPIYREAELRHILRDCSSKAVFIPGRYRGIDYPVIMDGLRAELPALQLVVGVRSPGDVSLEALQAEGDADAFVPTPARPDDIKLVMYTSGTTGPAKGVLHTHETLARVMSVIVGNWQTEAAARILLASPVGHIMGFMWGLESPFLFRTCVTLMDRWEPAFAVELIEKHRTQIMNGATPFLRDLLDAARAAGTRLPTLRHFGCGGASVPPSLIRDAASWFENATVFRVYGSTEAPNACQGHTRPEDAERGATTDGQPVFYEMRIVDEAGGVLPCDAEGEILVRGPSLFVGYRDATFNQAAFDADGWFRTGDVGLLTPAGDLVITDRKKDLIIRGGENLSPKEIEDALVQHPAVREVAAVGYPHERLGETVCVFVVRQPGHDLRMEDVAAQMTRVGLARQKHPEHLRLLEELPKNAAGKVRKDVLRQMLKAEA
jgi:acyl-CoA synthetase (AMP-forming)/AMP-acid ligase II